jgi:hypothetical protein
MSTEYEILRVDEDTYVSLDEHSNRLDLSVNFDEDKNSCVVRDLSPEQIVEMALEMLKVASYWMDSDDFNIVLKAYLEKKGPHAYEATVMRDIGRAAEEP